MKSTTRLLPIVYALAPTHCLGRLAFGLVAGAGLVLAACSTRPTPAASQPATTPVSAGLPDRPGLVTVIPFLHPAQYDHRGYVMIEAEVERHRGTFILDTGDPTTTLNSRYLQPSPTGGIDTVRDGQRHRGIKNVTIHTVLLGTLTVAMDSTDLGPPVPRRSNGDVAHGAENLLGNLGLNAMEPCETIIDYTHQRLVLIRLDQAGRRLAAVPAYTPAGAIPLVPTGYVGQGINNPTHNYWGLQTRLAAGRDTLLDTLIVDTGSPSHEKIDPVSQQAADRLRQAIQAGQSPANVVIDDTPESLVKTLHMFCYQFLSRLGVVGFNLRTHQLILYR